MKSQWTFETLLRWLGEEYGHVLEYCPEKHRAYIQDEDSDDGPERVPVALVRELIDHGIIMIWRNIGEWNHGYNTYKPTPWVKYREMRGISTGQR